jgi:hypothetical protein
VLSSPPTRAKKVSQSQTQPNNVRQYYTNGDNKTENEELVSQYSSSKINLVKEVNEYSDTDKEVRQEVCQFEKGEDSVSQFRVRQVPGDGGCMFHALATAIHFRETSRHYLHFDPEVRALSDHLRRLAVKTLQAPGCSFVLQAEDKSLISNQELLKMLAEEYNTTAEGYCANMLLPDTWGGGPELMALAHALKTPIHIYELATKRFFKFKFYLRKTAQFDHIFDPTTGQYVKLNNPPLQILFTDGKFPDISPLRSRIPINGDHFLALFPVDKGAVNALATLSRVKANALRKGSEYVRLGTSRIGTLLLSNAQRLGGIKKHKLKPG